MGDNAAPPEEPAKERYSLNILATVKACQLQNGLRHQNYQRYRQYCSKRLRRLRQALKLLNGRGRNYQKKVVTVETVKERRHLLMPLINAERAWAFAMELKETSVEEPRKRFRLLRRLRKASFWGAQLVILCAEHADEKTSLEAEAYAAWACANELMEREQWGAALEKYMVASNVYGQLGQVGSVDDKDLFHGRVDEIKPRVKFCQYNLARLKGEGDESAKALVQLRSATAGSASALLAAKLESVMLQERKKQAAEMSMLKWNDRDLPVRNERVRISIISADDKCKQMEQNDADAGASSSSLGEEKQALYLEIFSCYDDALRAIADDRQRGDKGVLDQAKIDADLELLALYVKHLKLQKTLERNVLLTAQFERNFEAQSADAAKVKASGVKWVRPTDLVRMYDTMLQNIADMRSVQNNNREDNEDDDEQDNLSEDVLAQEMSFRFMRCFYVALSYAVQSKWPQAFALFERALDLAADVQETNPDDASINKHIDRINGEMSRCRAQAFLMSLESKEPEETVQDVPLLQRLEHYHCGSKSDQDLPFSVAQVPPAFEPVPCKPLLFDVAFNGIQAPDLMHRLNKTQQEQATRRRRALEAEEEELQHEAKEQGQPEGWGAYARSWLGR